MEDNARIVRGHCSKFLGVLGVRRDIAMNMEHDVFALAAAHGLDRQMHALVAGDRTDVANVQRLVSTGASYLGA